LLTKKEKEPENAEAVSTIFFVVVFKQVPDGFTSI
jgi:hypothetical protein